jgi:hypothetical protein
MEQPDPRHYNEFLQNAIQILDTLVLSIELPPEIVAAINRQTEQYYMINEYKFRVQREAEESKRKQIEADGIAAFQKTVSQGISDSYLRWRGIEATLALAQSPNTKIVIIGSGKDGLPIILGNDVPTVPGVAPAGAPPAGTSAFPANTPPTPAPSAAPPAAGGSNGNKAPAGSSGEATPPPSGKAAAAGSPATPTNNEGQEASTSPLTLPDVQSIISRISGGLLPPGAGAGSAAAAKPKP